MCSWLPLMQPILGSLRTSEIKPAESGQRSIKSPKQTTRSSGSSCNLCNNALNVARWPWMSPTAMMRWPASRRACKSASRLGSLHDGPNGRSSEQLMIFPEEYSSPVPPFSCGYIVFASIAGRRGRFADLSHNFRARNLRPERALRLEN